MTDRKALEICEQLPPQLEERIGAFEHAAPTTDFDATSWFWMLLLGIAIPVLLLIIGWRL